MPEEDNPKRGESDKLAGSNAETADIIAGDTGSPREVCEFIEACLHNSTSGAIQIQLPGKSETFWCARGETDVQRLVNEGVDPRRILSATALKQLIRGPALTEGELSGLLRLKELFEAELVSVSLLPQAQQASAPSSPDLPWPDVALAYKVQILNQRLFRQARKSRRGGRRRDKTKPTSVDPCGRHRSRRLLSWRCDLRICETCSVLHPRAIGPCDRCGEQVIGWTCDRCGATEQEDLEAVHELGGKVLCSGCEWERRNGTS